MRNVTLLKTEKGFLWNQNKTTAIKGYFYDDLNKLYSGNETLSIFENIEFQSEFIKQIKSLNGIFTIIHTNKNDEIFIASDTSRIFPIYYKTIDTKILISDSIEFLIEKDKALDVNTKGEMEFAASGYTLGNKTLINNIAQIQSNEYLIFKDSKIINQGFFFTYRTSNSIINTKETVLKEKLTQTINNSFGRMIASLNNQQVFVPLSGGYDSRLIACLLKKHKYKNVICFTYGRKNNIEVALAKKTAETLSYPWIFIEYNKNLFRKFIEEESFKDYVNKTAHYSSMPFLQEYFAVKYLFKNKIANQNSIFIPGHSGDVLGGSLYIKLIQKNLNSKNIARVLYNYNFPFTKKTKIYKNEIINSIEKQLNEFGGIKEHSSSSIIEDFMIKERIAKFIINSSNIYEYFNYELRLPFWDLELLFYFKQLPKKYKLEKKLFNEVLEKLFFEPAGINFKDNLNPSKIDLYIYKYKKKIKKITPKKILNFFVLKNDYLNSAEMIEQMNFQITSKGIKLKPNIKEYNERIIEWYLHFIKGNLN